MFHWGEMVSGNFKVKNLRQRSIPISVTFQFPVELSGVWVWDVSEVVPSKVITANGQSTYIVGAPLCQGTGKVVLFSRDTKGGEWTPGPELLGDQAVSGGTDLTGDGLPDIAVGAEGQALLLRSRPVLRVGFSISFQPPTIPTSAFNCQGQEQLNTEASRAEVCFTVTKSTMDSLGNGISSTIQYSLALDPGLTKIRAAFDSTGPVLSRELRFGIEKKCETYRITLPLCPEDTLTPITLRLNYTLTGEPIAAAGRLRPILSEDSVPVSAGSLPFQKICGADGHCDDQLAVSFNFSGLKESTMYVNFSAKAAGTSVPVTHRYEVKNLRQRSVPISVTFQFPVELSGVRVWDASEVVPSKPELAQCNSEVETPDSRDFVKQMSERPLLDCSVATCKKIRCRIASLEMQQPLEFMIKGNVSFQWVSQTQQQKVSLVSEARIEYEEEKYTQKEGFVQRQAQVVSVVISLEFASLWVAPDPPPSPYVATSKMQRDQPLPISQPTKVT
ncbi:hypothetical protein KIL84_006974 [Mauremys mutica]|uniref:Integrin alpha-2 domain-containing protein n=1 Tax=Mauremys mutica TaxID=74926 RepID=A0A9D3X1X8_9SAUR|nr:hypothetical protein KIL84_006974 [Mauremys mutica]